MKNSVIDAFFVGRAVAEVLYERLEDAVTNAVSELGKFDAEARENLRQFSEEVQARAEQEARNYGSTRTTTVSHDAQTPDLQEEIDELRANIARVRTEIKVYRTQSPKGQG